MNYRESEAALISVEVGGGEKIARQAPSDMHHFRLK
jgi:hypothetical protein